jgi:hypothetical protein
MSTSAAGSDLALPDNALLEEENMWLRLMDLVMFPSKTLGS